MIFSRRTIVETLKWFLMAIRVEVNVQSRAFPLLLSKHLITARAASSISASVVKQPKLMRKELSLCWRVRPIAYRTRESSRMPDAQAQPVNATNLRKSNDVCLLTSYSIALFLKTRAMDITRPSRASTG